jgi:single-strand DNA-binding protein
MANFNQVILMGNITRDPQVKTLPSQQQVAEFGLATNRRYRTADGEDKEDVCFVECAVFGKGAEVINQYARKGRPLFVQGRLKYDSWEDKQGNKRSRLSVIVEQFQLLGGRPESDSQPGAPGVESASEKSSPERQQAPQKRYAPEQADIPF